MADQYALDIKWLRSDLPSLFGPFADCAEAEEWARLNSANGTYTVRVLAYPYYRKTEGESDG